MVTSSTNLSSDPGSPTQAELAALAQMTGYQTEEFAQKDPSLQPIEGDSESALLDDEDLEESDAALQTATPIWANPFAKGGFVALLMALAFGTVGLFLLSVNHHWSQKKAETAQQTTPAAAPAAQDTQQTEIGDLKTKEALGSQNQLLQQNARNNDGHILPQDQPRSSSSATAVPVRPIPVAYPTQERSYSPPPRLTMPVSSPRYAAPASATQAATVQPVDPQQAWQSAQALGSYGQTSTPAAFEQSSDPSSSGAVTAPIPSQSDQERYDADAAALLSGGAVQVVSIAPGTTAQADLVTPIIWAQDLKPEDQPQQFDIQLTEPLHAADGTIALPSGTRLVASVSTVSDSGLLELTVENAIVPTEDGTRIVPVPPGAIVISSDGGKPLIAENYRSDRGALLGHDIETTLLGALSEVGTLLNRPRNESTTTSPYLSSTSVTNGNTNIIGGILAGGFSALQTSLSQREQSQVQAVLSRPNLWYIKAGKSMQIFVNSPVEVRL